MIFTPYHYHDYIEVAVLAAKGDTIAQLELDARIQNNFLDAQMEIIKSVRKGDLKELAIAQKAMQATDYQDLEYVREDLREYREKRKKLERSIVNQDEFKEYFAPTFSSQLPDSLFNNKYRNVWGN